MQGGGGTGRFFGTMRQAALQVALGALLVVAVGVAPPALAAAPAGGVADDTAADEEPFSTRDNVVTGAAALADMGAGLVMHTVPAFLLLPLLAISVDALVARKPTVDVVVGRPWSVPTVGAFLALGAVMLAYTVLAPMVDAVVILGVRALDRQKVPRPAHVLATVVAAYLSFPVVFAGALGMVGFVSILAQPQLPAFVPERALVQSVLELILFAVTVEGVMLGVRPVALALFERAGVTVLQKATAAETAH